MKLSLIILSTIAIALLLLGCSDKSAVAPAIDDQSLSNVTLHTFVLSSASDSRLPAPTLEDQHATDEERDMIRRMLMGLDSRPQVRGTSSVRWNVLTTELGLKAKLPPPRMSRAYALVHVAIYDALVAAHEALRRDLWDNAVAAGAASQVLMYLFPNDSSGILRDIPLELRVEHGIALGRVLRSWVLGRRVGELVVAYGQNDGSNAVFTDTMPTGPGIWTGVNPVLPMCGTWKTWVCSSGSEFQPEPPYAYGSHEDSLDVQAVYEASLNRTPEQVAIVHEWADLPPPTIWNNYLNERIASYHLRSVAAARAHAYLNVAMYDGFVSCWETKYTYWIARPFQRIPGLVTVIPTPNFPSYTSGHSTISGAAALVMGELFPTESSYFNSEADEAALSRLWGGIHFEHDNIQGLVVGRQIGQKVVDVMRTDNGGTLLAVR